MHMVLDPTKLGTYVRAVLFHSIDRLLERLNNNLLFFISLRKILCVSTSEMANTTEADSSFQSQCDSAIRNKIG